MACEERVLRSPKCYSFIHKVFEPQLYILARFQHKLFTLLSFALPCQIVLFLISWPSAVDTRSSPEDESE